MSEKDVEQILRYYVVSEEELEELKTTAFNYWDMINNGRTDNSEEVDFDRLDKAKVACRARPVEKYGTFADGVVLWEEI